MDRVVKPTIHIVAYDEEAKGFSFIEIYHNGTRLLLMDLVPNKKVKNAVAYIQQLYHLPKESEVFHIFEKGKGGMDTTLGEWRVWIEKNNS